MEWCLLIVVDCLNEVVKLSEGRAAQTKEKLKVLDLLMVRRRGAELITLFFH